jgi:hypothetical protein
MREWSLLYTSERSREVIGRRRECVDFEFFEATRGKVCQELVLLRGNERVCNREEEPVSVPSIERRELHLDCERAGQHVFSSHQGSLGRFAAELIQRDDVGDSRTYVVADTHISRSPEEITLDEAFEQIKKDAVRSIDETGDRTMEEVLKMIDADLESRGGCTDSIDTRRSMLALRCHLKREEMRAKGVKWIGGVCRSGMGKMWSKLFTFAGVIPRATTPGTIRVQHKASQTPPFLSHSSDSRISPIGILTQTTPHP